jgi:Activator of Hsp90 ATPase homolog 1-like protein
MSTTEALAAIRKTITVDASVETAFETFTRGVQSWWPTATHSVYEDKVQDVVFDEKVGGRFYERSTAGEEADWADVIAWEPPRRFVLRWRVNPERGPTEVEVTFVPDGERTRVELEHRGWDEVADPQGRAGYDGGWDTVLGRYVESLTSE